MITIESLTIYPVKSMKGVSLESSDVDLIGLKGDRRWLVVDGDGKFQTIREHIDLAQIGAEYHPNGLLLKHPKHGTCMVPTPDKSAASCTVKVWRTEAKALPTSSEASAFLSGIFGRPLALLYLDDVLSRNVNPKFSTPNDHVSFADGYPILLTSDASRVDLEQRVGIDLNIKRFRANIVITGAEAWAEVNWKFIEIGAVRFRIARPCGRCIVTTLDPDTGAQNENNEPLATLSKFHRAADGEIIFGQNLIPDGTGHIAVGDEVTVLEAGSSNLL
jgi:uncharacterized protein